MMKKIHGWPRYIGCLLLCALILTAVYPLTAGAETKAHSLAGRGTHPDCLDCGDMTTTWGVCMGRDCGKSCYCWLGYCKASGCLPKDCFIHADGNCDIYTGADCFGASKYARPTRVVLSHSGTVRLNLGETLPLSASLRPVYAVSALTWSSSNKKIATVDANGLVTPVREGTAIITVKTRNGKKDTVKIKVVDPYKPTAIVLNQSGTVRLDIDKTLSLSFTLSPSTAQTTPRWWSSNKKIATVDANGLVTPVREGTAIITVKTHNDKRDTVKVKVVDPYKPTAVVLNQSGTVYLKAGDTLNLTAALKPSTALTTLTWSSSSKKVAMVDANGVVTAHGKGTAIITVKTRNGKKDTVKVKVSTAPPEQTNHIELSSYMWANLHETIKRFPGMKDRKYSDGEGYSNGTLEFAQMWGGSLEFLDAVERYDYPVVTEIRISKPSPYSLFGIYASMSMEDAEKLLTSQGWKLDSRHSYEGDVLWYKKAPFYYMVIYEGTQNGKGTGKVAEVFYSAQ